MNLTKTFNFLVLAKMSGRLFRKRASQGPVTLAVSSAAERRSYPGTRSGEGAGNYVF